MTILRTGDVFSIWWSANSRHRFVVMKVTEHGLHANCSVGTPIKRFFVHGEVDNFDVKYHGRMNWLKRMLL